nr:MAG TPA: hypothetical protein [Caudoviricetes sp.]
MVTLYPTIVGKSIPFPIIVGINFREWYYG